MAGVISKPIFVKEGDQLSFLADNDLTFGQIAKLTDTGDRTVDVCGVGETGFGVVIGGNMNARTQTANTVEAGQYATLRCTGICNVLTDTSAILVGSLSDVIFPYLGAQIISLQPKFHLPILEQPLLILGSALLGSLAGIKLKTTKIPHTFHVFLSVFASLFYLMAYTTNFTLIHFFLSIIVVSIAVIIPCCVSDILLPFFFLKKKIRTCDCHSQHCKA